MLTGDRGINMKRPNKKLTILIAFFAMMLCCTNVSAKNVATISMNETKFSYNIYVADISGFKFANVKINCAGEEIPYGAPYIVHNIINLLKIITPIVLIILGMVDFTRAVVASDEKQMKEASTRFIRRIFAAVVVFFVVVIVQFVFSLLGSNDESALGCFNCFVNGSCYPYSDTKDDDTTPSTPDSNTSGSNTSNSSSGGVTSSSGHSHGGSSAGF